MRAQNVTIIGMNRMGASIGLALKQSKAQLTIIGHDRENQLALTASKLGAVDKTDWNLIGVASKADILILTVPFSELENTLIAIGEEVQPHALILDFSNLKSTALKWADKHLKRGHYVGAVPVLAASWLADGRDELEAANAQLFQNSLFCLMPSPHADPQAVDTAVTFGHLLGAIPYFVDPMEYDSLVQGLETIPGLLAAAMFSAVQKSTGWRDMLRFAGQPFALTTQPLRSAPDLAQAALNNKIATLRWLDALMEELRTVHRWIRENDAEDLKTTLLGLGLERDKWLKDRSENNWVEAKAPEISGMSVAEQMLGRWGRKEKKEE